MEGKFKYVATVPGHPQWEKLTARQGELYAREDDIRSPFARDYTRILHSTAYRRLKHKTQVFYNIDNDHICTRIEHVSHVESVSGTIARALGLNDELTRAIATGHDLGHAPFGHEGEGILRRISQEHLGKSFWHEQNGLRFVDSIELLEDPYKVSRNLDLTYAVRDGIISHCGEVDENGLAPRAELIDLAQFERPGQFMPATWEGCVVKISDKIAYVGRDIEDAIRLGFLDAQQQHELLKMARIYDQDVLNTTVIMHNLIIDICKNSSPDRGICLSDRLLEQLNNIKDFNYRNIYSSERLRAFVEYAELVLGQIFKVLLDRYKGEFTWSSLAAERRFYPQLISSFETWLAKYCDPSVVPQGELQDRALGCENEKIYGRLETKELYVQGILDFISGMTDRFAIKVFTELLTY